MNDGSKRGPSLCKHKRSGRGYARLEGRQHWFGPFDDPKTHAEFAAFKLRWETNGRRLPEPEDRPEALTVADVVARWLEHLEQKHDPAWQAGNLPRIVLALRAALDLLGPSPAATFTPLRLQEVRASMLQRGKLSRGEINDRLGTIKRAFRWAVAQELVPLDLAHGLDAVESLRAGDFGAREGRTVGPVDEATVWATLPYLSRQAAALVELLWWTGARPSELFGLRPCDLDRSKEPWALPLVQHKTVRKGKRREVYFGPEARTVLERFLNRVPPPASDRPLFSPAAAEVERRAEQRQQRKTPLWPSHLERYDRQRAAEPERTAGEVYTAASFRRAVERAVSAANRERKAQGLPPLERWHPYQLRHAAATRINREGGLELVRCVLGHSSATMSEVYAEADLEKARRVVERAG